METACGSGVKCGTKGNSARGSFVRIAVLAAVVLALGSPGAFADINRNISNGFSIVNMTTPDAWSYLKNVTYNPAVALILGGLAPCDGNMGIIYSDRGDQRTIMFKFTSSVTGGSVLYLVSDVYKFLGAIHEAKTSTDPIKPGVLCHEGVDMTDGTRSNYVLHRTESGGFVMELERAEIGIRFALSDDDVKALMTLAEDM